MPLYINGRPVNPVVSFLVSAVVLAGIVGLGILLLPVIGGIFLFIAFCVLAIALYGAYYRWRHGDPVQRMQEELMKQMRQRAGGFQSQEQTAESQTSEACSLKKDQVRTGVKRITTVEDVVVVEEIRRRDP